MKRVVSVCLCLLGVTLFAHEVELTIRDADLAIPLEGARVRIYTGQVIEADKNGFVKLEAPDDRTVVILVDYPGYQSKKVVCKSGDTRISVSMQLSGVSESKELVVEGKRADKTDAKIGESVAIKRETIQETGKMGLVEDVMTSIKTLPGVGYSGGFNAMPSIRGGDPSDLVACLDGFYIDSPYHWGGAYSIFNPNMVESAKLSHGVFSVKHGNASSGLLEVTSIEPDPDNIRTDLAVTTSALELGVSMPLAGNGGLFVGGKVTYWDPFIYIAGLVKPSVSDSIAQAPYIRDAYMKGNYHLSEKTEVYMNGFLGSDGIGMRNDHDGSVSSNEFKTRERFDYSNELGYFSGGMKIMPSKKMLVNFNMGAGFDSKKLDYTESTSGVRRYSDTFSSLYGSLLSGATSYTLQGGNNEGSGYTIHSSYQGRIDTDWELTPWMSTGFGLTEIARCLETKETLKGWHTEVDKNVNPADNYDPLTGKGIGEKEYYYGSVDNTGSKTYSTGVYALFNLHTPDKRLSTEFGLRVDHLYFVLGDYKLNTVPVLNPRASVSYDLIKNSGPIDHMTLTVGSGLFSHLTPYQDMIDKNSGLGNKDLKPDRSWNSVGGVEIQLGDMYKFSLEGYYKHVFDRSYANVNMDDSNQTVKWHFDGQAEIFGCDLLLQKLTSRYLDGWITYSFNYARYRKPVLDDGTTDTSEGPKSTGWYYPYFHRFHTANLVLDWKPVQGLDLLTKVAIASGKPKSSLSASRCYAIRQPDGTYAEYWTQEETYSDTSRTTISIPVDLKLTWTKYNKDKKTKTQFYIAVEDVFTNLYHSTGNTSIDPYTGEEEKDSSAADFNIGIPMPSIGVSWSY